MSPALGFPVSVSLSSAPCNGPIIRGMGFLSKTGFIHCLPTFIVLDSFRKRQIRYQHSAAADGSTTGSMDGGGRDREQFLTQYEGSLAEYRRVFSEEAPKDIWPEPQQRLKDLNRYRRVDLSRPIRKVRSRTKLSALLAVAAAFFLLFEFSLNPLLALPTR